MKEGGINQEDKKMYFPRKQPPLNIFFLVFTDAVVRCFQLRLQARVVGEEAEVGIGLENLKTVKMC